MVQLRDLVEAGCTELCVGHVVTVVDCAALWAALHAAPDFDGPEPGVTSLERTVEQIEWATVVVFADQPQPTDPIARSVVALVMMLNPTAALLSLADLESGDADAPRLPADAMAHLRRAPGWIGELNGRKALSFAAPVPMRSVVFRDPRPFHPARLAALLEQGLGDVLRSRGFATLASRPERALSWSSAGEVLSLSPAAADAAVHGQELVFYGLGLDARVMADALAECLLTPAELLLGPAVWRRLADPFPS